MKSLFRLFFFIAIIASLLFVSAAFAQSDDGPVRNINPYFSGPLVEVSSNENIVIGWGWASGTAGQVNSLIGAVEQQYILDGQLIFVTADTSEGWLPISHTDPIPECQPPGLAKKGKAKRPTARTRWEYNLGQLAPGDHVLQGIVSLTQQVTDGCDFDSDGVPETFGPGILCVDTVCLNTTITIRVHDD